MKIKASRKIIMAALALLMAVGLAAGSTFAWFSMNNTVKVDGMQVKTKVSSNLLVSPDTTESNFKTTLTQDTSKGILEPASTINGVDYYYTLADNVDVLGSAISSSAYLSYASVGTTASSSAEYTDKFSEANGITKSSATTIMTGENKALAYVDYSFYLKVTNTEGEAKEVRLTKMNLLYNNGAIDFGASGAAKAWRTAIFTKAAGTASCTEVTDEVAEGNLKSILAPSGATYFTANSAVEDEATISLVSELGEDAVLFEAPVGNSYYKVTVRLWLEGEDNTCNNTTYATLTNAYSLDLAIEFNQGTAATTITSVAP